MNPWMPFRSLNPSRLYSPDARSMKIAPYLREYAVKLAVTVGSAQASRRDKSALDIQAALAEAVERFRKAHTAGGKIIFIGNGGSAALASHQAFDYWKNGGLRAMALNDGVLLTASANDYGYPDMFAKPLAMYATKDDVVVTVSSSGKSENILNAAREAGKIGCYTVTLSAFEAENPLRTLGDVNFYLDTKMYGHAEIGHETILHAMLDWTLFGCDGQLF